MSVAAVVRKVRHSSLYLRSPIDYAVWMKTITSALTLESSDAAQFRLHVLDVYYHHGWRAAVSAFKIGKSTLYDWKTHYEQSAKNVSSLVPQSTRPRRVRAMQIDPRLLAFLRAMRETYGNISKYKLVPFVAAYSAGVGMAPVGTTTIGKIITRYRLFEAKTVRRKSRYGNRMRSRHAPRETTPGYLEMDSVTLYVAGTKWLFMSVIDVVTKVAHVAVVPSLSAVHAVRVIEEFLRRYPSRVRVVQTDNGSEFLASFHEFLDAHGITHQFIYPRSPRINGVVERFNRTIQDEFLNRSDELFFNKEKLLTKLEIYLTWYNTKRPHYALKFQAPLVYHQQLLTFSGM